MRATAWIVSCALLAFIWINSDRIAGLSSWKQPRVSPLCNSRAVCSHRWGMAAMSGRLPLRCSIRSRTVPISETQRLPSRSILINPVSSMEYISSWVMMIPRAALSTEAICWMGRSAMQIPPGCTDR